MPYLPDLTAAVSSGVRGRQDGIITRPGDAAGHRRYSHAMPDLDALLEELDQLLLDQGDDWMLLTQLDGFLTGIAIGPDPVPPGTWLRHVWAGEDGSAQPAFDNLADFQHMLDLIMQHYNQILASLTEPGAYEPVFDIDTRNDDIIWEMWVEGFVLAMDLAPEGWRRVAASDDAACVAALKGINKLFAIAHGRARLSRTKEDHWVREAPDLIPIWVEALHTWRLENDSDGPALLRHGKVGRNDSCTCGSGNKYKKCCGLN